MRSKYNISYEDFKRCMDPACGPCGMFVQSAPLVEEPTGASQLQPDQAGGPKIEMV